MKNIRMLQKHNTLLRLVKKLGSEIEGASWSEALKGSLNRACAPLGEAIDWSRGSSSSSWSLVKKACSSSIVSGTTSSSFKEWSVSMASESLSLTWLSSPHFSRSIRDERGLGIVANLVRRQADRCRAFVEAAGARDFFGLEGVLTCLVSLAEAWASSLGVFWGAGVVSSLVLFDREEAFGRSNASLSWIAFWAGVNSLLQTKALDWRAVNQSKRITREAIWKSNDTHETVKGRQVTKIQLKLLPCFSCFTHIEHM